MLLRDRRPRFASPSRLRFLASFCLLAACLAAPMAQAVAPLTEPIETAAGETQGDWADQLVLEMPPAPRGFAPRVVLMHAKDARGTVVGDGFVLSVGGSIVRRSATGGVPGHTKEDLYLLDGQALIRVEGDAGGAGSGLIHPSQVGTVKPGTPKPGALAGLELRQEIYRLEDDRGDLLRWHRASNTWTRTRDGWTWVYGQRFFGVRGDGAGSGIQGAKTQGALIPKIRGLPGATGINATQRLVHRGDPRTHGRSRPFAGASNLVPSGPSSPPNTFDTSTGTCSVAEANPLPRCNTARWMLSRVEDPYGNWMLYHYTVEPMPEKVGGLYGQGDGRRLLLERIEWFTANSQEAASQESTSQSIASQTLGEVVFRYGPQPAPRLSFAGGTRSFSGQRLTAVEVLSGSGETYALYELEYKDEDGEDCDGEPLRLNGDDSRDLEGERPLQSLLRRVVRVDPEEPSRRRTLRCLETHHERLRGSNWGDEENLTDVLPAPGITFSPGETRVTPVPVEVNGDGKMDLLVLASGSRSYDDRLFLAQGRKLREPFEEDDEDPGSNAWLELADRHLSPDEPFLVADFNRDGYTDVLYPDGEDQGALRLYTPVFHHFGATEVDVAECDLRFATSADIDGDGYPDLVRRGHTKTDDCPGRGRTRWLRNRGEAPWFDQVDWQDLQVPLDALGIKALEMEIPDLNPDWTPALFAAEQASFQDVNGDGIADLLYAFYQRWEQHLNFAACPDPPPSGDEEPCQWRPDTQSVYSRIFFGDGYGHFVDSKLHAGAPTYHHYPGWPGWYFTTYRALQDLDRSGTPELLHGLRPSGSEPYVAVASWRGVAYGFSRGAAGEAQNPWAPDELLQLPLHEYPDQGQDCFDEPEHQNLSVPVIADFDGDGFPDLLELRWDKERRQSSCDQSGWCAGIRWSQRTVSQGRVTSSDGSWGGRTELEWGFTGPSLLYENTELRNSAEVLTAADGAAGRVEMGYGWGLHADGGFRGFGLVRRRNARGGLVTSVTGQSPPLQGRPLLRARHRQGGDLEKVTVTAYGRLTEDGEGYALDVEPPYFNPLLRECHFELERTSPVPELHELIRECYAWNGRTAPSWGDLWAAYGLDRWIFRTPERNTAWAVWNAPGEDEEEIHPLSAREDEPLLLWPNLLQPYYREVGWRWPAPAPVRGSGALLERTPAVRPELSNGKGSALGKDRISDKLTGKQPVDPILRAPTWLPEEPDIERVLARLPEPARGEGWTLHVTDYLYEDPAVPRPTRILYHRNAAIPADDLEGQRRWENRNGWRLVEETLRDGAGTILHQRNLSDFDGFDDPGRVEVCGEGGEDCRVTLTTRHPHGEPASREIEGVGVQERWEMDPWCGTHRTIDAAGRVFEERFDDHCRLVEESWRGVVSTFEYDGLHRVTRSERSIHGTGNPEVTEFHYDDLLTHREDESFLEPRWAELEGDRLMLEYLDGFGRSTRRISCRVDHLTVDGSHDLDAGCEAGTRLVESWIAYGTDGLPRAQADPYYLGQEQPAFSVVPYRDSAGRPMLRLRPAPVDLREEPRRWVSETTWWAPARRVDVDPLDRVVVERSGTLRRSLRLDGRLLSSERLDAFGRTVRAETPERGAMIFEYDPRHRVRKIQREATAETLGPNGNLAPAVWSRRFEYDALDRLVRRRKPDGTVVELDLDPLGRPLSETLVDRGGRRLRLASWEYRTLEEGTEETLATDQLGAQVLEVRDGLDRPVRREDAAGVVTDWFYEPHLAQRRREVTDGPRQLTFLDELDIHGRTVASEGPLGRVERVLDGGGRVTTRTGADGARTHRRYLFSGQLAREELEGEGPEGEDGRWLLYQQGLDDAGRTIDTRIEGVRRRTTYDALDRPVRIDHGFPNPLKFEELTYDGDSFRVLRHEVEAPGVNSHTKIFAYDPWGRRVEEETPGVGSRYFAYDLRGRLRRTTDEEGVQLERRYDPQGRLSALDLPGAGSVSLRYRSGAQYTRRLDGSEERLDRLMGLEATFADGSIQRFWFDGAGHTIAAEDPLGGLEETRWQGSLPVAVDRGGPATETTRTRADFDDNGLPRWVYGPALLQELQDPADGGTFDSDAFDGYRIERTFGPGGRLEAIDAGGEVTRFGYDAVSGLVISESYRGLEEIFEYSPATPDALHTPRLVGRQMIGRPGPGGDRAVRREQRRYDALGRLVEQRFRGARGLDVLQWQDLDSWDQPRRSRRLRSADGAAPTEEVRLQWTYDSAGRPTGRRLFLAGVDLGESTWSWYRNDVLKSEAGANGPTLEYDYGTPFDFRLDRVWTPQDGTVHGAVLDWNKVGQPTTIELPDGSLELRWDSLGRLTERRSLDAQGDPLGGWRGSYDALGRLVAEQKLGRGGRSWQRRFGYDGAGRLVTERLVSERQQRRDGEPLSWRYRLNTAGGRIATESSAVPPQTVGYDPDHPLERVVQVGDQALSLDPWDGVLRDQHGIVYRRRPDGSVEESGRGENRYHLYRDAAGLPVATEDADGRRRLTEWRLNPAAPPISVRDFDGSEHTYPNLEGVALRALTTRPAGAVEAEAETWLAEVAAYFSRFAASSSSTSASPMPTAFGVERTRGVSLGPSPLGYAGMETLPGLESVAFARHRVYDPQTGRFLRPDPAGLRGGLHRTLYAHGDPVQYADPLGLWACPLRPTGSFGGGAGIEIPQPGPGPSDAGMIGSINTTWEIAQLERSMGIGTAAGFDGSQLDLTSSGPFDLDPCGFKCDPPSGGEEGLPGDDVDPIGTYGSGPHTALFGGGGKERRQERREARRERRNERRYERWEKQLERRLNRMLARGEIDPSRLDEEGLAYLDELAIELVGCTTSACQERRLHKIDVFLLLLRDDPPQVAGGSPFEPPSQPSVVPTQAPSESLQDADRRQQAALDAIERSRKKDIIVTPEQLGLEPQQPVAPITPPPSIGGPTTDSPCPPDDAGCWQRYYTENPAPKGTIPEHKLPWDASRLTLEEKLEIERRRRMWEKFEELLRQMTEKVAPAGPWGKLPIYIKPRTREICIGKGPVEVTCTEIPDGQPMVEKEIEEWWQDYLNKHQ